MQKNPSLALLSWGSLNINYFLNICSLSALRISFSIKSEAAKELSYSRPGGSIGEQGLEMTAPSWLCVSLRPYSAWYSCSSMRRMSRAFSRQVIEYLYTLSISFSPTKLKVVYGSIRLIVLCSLEPSTSSMLSPPKNG